MKSVPAYAGASPGRPDTHWIRPPLPTSSGSAIGLYRKSGCLALIGNLQDVFGENDPARRRAAIDEIYTEDVVFYETKQRMLTITGASTAMANGT
jgi:hypothetical protein